MVLKRQTTIIFCMLKKGKKMDLVVQSNLYRYSKIDRRTQ
jgi:hypothetical protein